MCHNKKTDGFSIISHNPCIEYIKEVLDKKNTENIDVYTGPHHELQICQSKFKEQCTAYFERYFEVLANEDPQILPWKIPHEFKSITDIMFDWCKETNEFSNIKGLVVHSFFVLEHLFRHGFTKKMLQDCLQIENFSETPIIVVYNPGEKALLLLRKAESKKLATDIALSINDLKLFILLFHDVLANTGMKLVSLVITDQKVNPDDCDCHLCLNHVLSLQEFLDIGEFNFFWKERGGYFETEYKGEINEVLSKTISAKLAGILGAALLHPNYIPIFTDKQNVHQHMEHLTVLLTPEQLDVYYSQNKHMIVKGGFGCGKSIIAAAMLQKIFKGLEEDEKLIHVCYDPRSELLSQMAKINQDKSIDDRVVTLNNKDGLNLSAIIENVTKQERTGKINVVVDEYDGEDLDESEGGKLNQVFSESLKESFIVLIAQPIEKERVINKIPQKKNQFGKLETMKTYDLTLNMRNSIEIHQMVETTKEVLKEEKTVFIHPKGSERSAQLINIKVNYNSDKNVSMPENPRQPVFESEHEFGGQPKENSSNSKMGLDEAQAIIGSSEVDVSGRSSTESKFAFAEVEKTGHQINTKRPVLFELGDEKEFHKYLSLAICLKKLLTIRSKHVVLHFHTETNVIPSALRFAFEHFDMQKKITTKYKEFQSSENSVLVCSFPSFRGLEYPIITVLIDRDIYFVQHYLVETFSRCTSELCIIVLKDSPIMAKVTTEWKTKELICQWGVNISSKNKQRDDIKNKIEKGKNQNTINATFKSEYYGKLEEAFKQLSNSNDETMKPMIEQRAKEIIDQNR